MANFDKLDKLAVPVDKTGKYVFPVALGADESRLLTLICVPASLDNKGLTNAMLKLEKSMGKRSVNADRIVQNRQNAVKTWPKYVVVGWENVFDDDGKTAVSYSTIECEKLLDKLAKSVPDMFDDFRDWAASMSNFREEAEVVAKN